MTSEIRQRNTVDDRGVWCVKFIKVLSHKFGEPSDEGFTTHPLFSEGLKYYTAHELSNSPWIVEMKNRDKELLAARPNFFSEFKHYLFAFHDNTFECVSSGFEARYLEKDMYDVIIEVVQDVFSEEM